MTDQPREVSIETLALCNARCTFCPYPTLERIGTKMPDELIHRLIDEMAAFEKPFYFSPFKVNEPFLDARLLDICRRVNERVPKAILRLFSNGSPLTERKLAEVAALQNVVHLWISLNTCDPQEYTELMGLDFNQTARRLDALHAMDFPHPVVVSKVSGVNDAFFAQYVTMRWPKFKPFVIKRDGWLGFVDPSNPAIPSAPCGRWFELSVVATGRVSLCCMDGKAEFPIGDVKSQSLLEVYNSPHWRSYRESVTRSGLHPCRTCTYL